MISNEWILFEYIKLSNLLILYEIIQRTENLTLSI